MRFEWQTRTNLHPTRPVGAGGTIDHSLVPVSVRVAREASVCGPPKPTSWLPICAAHRACRAPAPRPDRGDGTVELRTQCHLPTVRLGRVRRPFAAEPRFGVQLQAVETRHSPTTKPVRGTYRPRRRLRRPSHIPDSQSGLCHPPPPPRSKPAHLII